MPKSASSRPNTNNWAETIFVNIKLTGKGKDQFTDWMNRKEPEIALDVAQFMSNGHKTSITWDSTNNCWIVSSTCKIQGSVNENHCMTSRSQEWYEAMCMNVFKSAVLCNNGAWSEQQESSDWG